MDFETIKFISLLNQLAEKSKNGYIPFLKATAKNKNCILYDDESTYSNGHPIVCDTCIDEIHHDIIDTYNEIYDPEGIVIRLVIEGEESFINITCKYDTSINIVVDNGTWYTV